MLKEGISNAANTKRGMDGKTWTRLKRIAIVVCEKFKLWKVSTQELFHKEFAHGSPVERSPV